MNKPANEERQERANTPNNNLAVILKALNRKYIMKSFCRKHYSNYSI